MTRPILVFGAGGRVGGALFSVAPSHWIAAPEGCNIRNSSAVGGLAAEIQPSAIVNLAACTLPYAEQESAKREAQAVNGAAVTDLASLCVERSMALIHMSTDCVFSGAKAEPYAPEDTTGAINWYGVTKLSGEQGIRRSAAPHIIIRTTGVYLRDKPNFLKLVLDKAKAGEAIEVVSDTLYTPTDARELAKAILTTAERVTEDPSVSGTYHFAGPDVMSYLDFARLVAEEAGVSIEIKPTTAAEREAIEGFKRPRNAALDSAKFAQAFGLSHRPTRECVAELVM